MKEGDRVEASWGLGRWVLVTIERVIFENGDPFIDHYEIRTPRGATLIRTRNSLRYPSPKSSLKP